MRHYKDHFRGKTVYCNCDDPSVSNFSKFFELKFEEYGLKRLITTCYQSNNPDLFSNGKLGHGWKRVYDGDKNGNRVADPDEIEKIPLNGDGDFRSAECIELLKQSDIVVTNPPFSLFREYVQQLVEHGKQFLIIGNMNAITYTGVFEHIQSGNIWLGRNGGDMAFHVPDSYEARETRSWIDPTGQKWRSMGNTYWFTNMDYQERHEDLILYKKYTPEAYPTYDNYDAIEVGKNAHIPEDYFEPMGVPITFLHKHNPSQFQVIGATESEGNGFSNGLWHKGSGVRQAMVKGNRVFKRIFIRRIKP